MYSLLIGNGLLYYRALRYGSNVPRYKAFLDKSQWWPHDKILWHQNERLKVLIDHAGKNVPFYSRLLKALGIKSDKFSIEQLASIPPVTKDTIRANPEDFIAVNAENYPHRRVNTSGSTGAPFNYLQDVSTDEMQVACSYRGLGVAGYRYTDKIVVLAGSALIPGISLTSRQKLSNAIQRIKPLAAIKLDVEKLDSFTDEINRFKPSFIRGYPSSISILADHIKSGKKLRSYPRAVITTAEVLLPKYREKIESIFRCPVYDEYGCNDGGLISYECGEHNGLHYGAEKTIVEIERGNSLLPDGCGEVMLTDLYNFSMPFIRYKNGDIAKLAKSSCACGRGLPLIEAVQGRSGDILRFFDRYIATPALTLIFKDFSFDQYQLIKKSNDLLVINAIKNKSYNPVEESRLLKILKHHLGDQVGIQLNFVSQIETTAAGKRKFFIDRSEKN